MQNGILSGGPAVRAVVLDLDGTLVDSAADIAAALSDVFEAADLPRVGADAVESALGFGAFQLVRTVLETVDPRRAADDAAVAALLERYLVRYAADPARHSTVYADGVAAVTDLHRAGVRLGVCTNKDTALSEAVLDAVGLAGLIDVVLGRDAVPHPKPDPRHLLDVLDRLGVAGHEALYVGDNPIDVAVARGAGTGYRHVAWGVPVNDAVPRLHRFGDLLALTTTHARPSTTDDKER